MNQTSNEQRLLSFDAALSRLDPYQRAVADRVPEPGKHLRVLAGAGAGKTATLVAWVARLLWQASFAAGEVIVTTFTRKAANELVERLGAIVPEGALDPEGKRPGTLRVGTFHSLALRALRQADPRRWDLKRCMDVDGRASEIPGAGYLWSRIVGWAGKEGLPGTGAPGLELEDVDAKAYSLAIDVARSSGASGEKLERKIMLAEQESGLKYLHSAWTRYCDVKRALGAWDFADALTALCEGLERGEVTDAARLVIVDEAQDNSEVQLRIARSLARNGTLVLVGDVRQSIYGWRGAYPAMLAEADRILGAESLALPTNYRSAQRIVTASNAVAEGQPWAVGPAAVAHRTDEGTITAHGGDTPEDEAEYFASEIQISAKTGRSYSDHAVLVRTNALAGVAEAALVAAGIPCVVVGGTPFFARKDVKDCLAYVSLAQGDDVEALARIVNRPKRFLGAQFVEAVKRAPGASLIDKIERAGEGLRNSNQRGSARTLAAFVASLRHDKWPATLDRIVRLLAPTAPAGSGEADDDVAGVYAAVQGVGSRFPGAREFLDFAARCAGEVTAVSDGAQAGGRVVISTLHKAKGLEWPVVFLSASGGVFPHARSESEERIAEERRLYYVGVSRARDVLHLTWSNSTLFNKPSGPSVFHALVPGVLTPEQAAPPAAPEVKAKPPRVRKAKAVQP